MLKISSGVRLFFRLVVLPRMSRYALSLAHERLFRPGLRWPAVFLATLRQDLSWIWAYIKVEFKTQPVCCQMREGSEAHPRRTT